METQARGQNGDLIRLLTNIKVGLNKEKDDVRSPLSVNNSGEMDSYTRMEVRTDRKVIKELRYPSDLFPSGFPTNVPYAILFCPIPATGYVHLSLLISCTFTRTLYRHYIVVYFFKITACFPSQIQF